MKKFSLVLILVCLLMLKCGEQGEKVIGSRDHDIKTLKATTPEILADGISTTQIIATVYDKNGVAAQNKKVIFRTTYGSIEPYTYTNSDGMAVVLLMSIASTTDLMAEVTATVVDTTFESLGKEQPSPFIITLHIPGYDNEPQSLTKPNDHTATIYVKFLGVTLSAAIEEAILPADGLTESRVTIKLQETTSQKAIPNAKVQLALKYGTVVSSTTTDNQGKAEVYLRAATQAGKDTLRVDYGNKLSTSLNISYVTPKLELSSNTAQVPADGESKIQIIATVVTHKNTPIVGAEVKFSASAGIIKESAITDQYGKAKVELIAGRKPDLKVVVLAKFLALKDSVTVAFISTLHDYPNSIILEADPNFIWVKETGNLDQTTIIATVLGVTGLPVGNDFKVKFSIANGPDGGETIEPSSSSDKKSSIVQTMDGQAKAYFRAGIRSGTVQIRAELVDYPQVAAQTTNIVIRSGPPYMWIDPTNVNHVIPHATMLVQTGKHNVGFARPVQDINITVIFGDKYNNPIEEGTTVYFTTTGGIITTDAVTCEKGRATVILQNCYPFPVLISEDKNQLTARSIRNPNDENVMLHLDIPDFEGNLITNSMGTKAENDGIAVLLAYTWGQNQYGQAIKVWTDALVVFSDWVPDPSLPSPTGVPHFTAKTNRTSLKLGEYADIEIRLFDINGNPVAASSRLTASTTAGQLTETNLIPTAENYGYGTTYFYTQLLNNLDPENDKPSNAIVTISLDSPNGCYKINVPPIFLSLENP